LAKWLRSEHPGAAQATAKTIENGIRSEYWKLKRLGEGGSSGDEGSPLK
jgi:hypothetical protein